MNARVYCPALPPLLGAFAAASFNAFIVGSPSLLLTNLRFSLRSRWQRSSTSPDRVLKLDVDCAVLVRAFHCSHLFPLSID